jgi:trimeric autotransporter adhesin
LSGPSLTAEIQAFPANGIVCAGQGATLTAIDNAPNPMYHWSGPDGFTSNQAAFSLSGFTPEQAGYYHVTVTDQSGCVLLTASQQIQVVDFEPIIQSLPASGLLCEEEGFSLSAANLDEDMYTFSWQGPGGELVSTGQTYSTVSAQPGQSGVYILTATDLNGCAEQASADITVHALPAVAIQPEPESAAVCEGDGFSLSAEASPGGLDYAWLGPGISSNEAVITIEEASLNQSGVYAITVTDENGCAQDDSQFVTVHPLPTVGITTSPFDSEVCEGAPFSFTVNTNAGEEVSYSWQGPGGFTSNQPSIGTDAAVIAQDGLYGLTITDGNGCSRTASANLTVFPLPTIATGIEPADATVCAGDDFSITSTASGADIVSYDWDGPGGFDSDLPSFTVENAELGQSGAYTLEVEDINGCRQQAELMVTVISFVAGIQTLPGSGTVCEGASIELQPINDADSPIFQWAGPDGFSSNEEVVTLTNMSDEKAGNYVLRIRDKHGCTQTANALLVLAALPELEVTQENSTIFVSASGGVPPYTFTIAGGVFGERLNFPGIIENVEADNYTISVEDANGCTNSTSAVVATHSVDPAEAWGLYSGSLNLELCRV